MKQDYWIDGYDALAIRKIAPSSMLNNNPWRFSLDKEYHWRYTKFLWKLRQITIQPG